MPSKSADSPASSWRTFVAIEVPVEVRQRVLDHAQRLRSFTPSIQASWTRLENIHLTLKFFGNVARDEISQISAAADAVCEKFSPIDMRVEGTGTFPRHGPPRVLWIGLNDPSDKLLELQNEFEFECARRGFPAEDRVFHPHLTVARLRIPHGSRKLGELHKTTKFPAIGFKVTELTVLRSELSSDGSRYTKLSTHVLRT